ncbi:MAG TPA: lipase secretion chaperone [Noviherbaspirillum sp.]|uniref:lipase secretion chaperone n=1 Tax=Noviherbaspirillum sp. TaxID=1926288 RepID=UPI002D5A03A4|nr:lipase secretion chaperone [Noviherbaspirillum sp.]HYD93798.1 lipase secretion chaperone [Noviherbaspirillum sp.]
MPITKRGLLIGAAALGAAVAWFGLQWLQPEHPPQTPPQAAPDLFPFVRSLQGTVPDGRIDSTLAAEQVASAELVRLFDYYLSAVGETPVDAIRAEIERELGQRLKPEAAAEARRLLARYIDYKRALVEVEKSAQANAQAGGSAQAVRARFAQMQEARRHHFSEREMQAMFADSDATDLDAIARLEVMQDADLTEEQKRERLAQLDAALPAPLREAREAPLRVVRLEEAAQKMRAQGASEDDIYRMRAAALSPEAAARMAQVDREEQEWAGRIAAYLAERKRLLAAAGPLAAEERDGMLAQLRQARFSPEEQRRLPAYEPQD